MSQAAQPTPAFRRTPLNCVVVEDQGLFLEMLVAMLGMRGGLQVAASALTVKAGLQACKQHRPELLILDLQLPDGDGLEVAELLLKINPAAHVIVVSAHASEFVCPPWLQGNLQAVLSKNAAFASLREELDQVLDLAGTNRRSPDKKNFESKPLSGREAEIFGLIGEGLTSKEIGLRLFVSEHTVQAHRKRIALKLGTTGAELTQRAIAQRQKFFTPTDKDS